MRRVLAATAAIWAVLAIAIVIAIGHRPAASTQVSAPATVVVVRQANGKLTLLPVATHTTTQTSGSPAGNQISNLATSGQLVPNAAAPTNHATTRSS